MNSVQNSHMDDQINHTSCTIQSPQRNRKELNEYEKPPTTLDEVHEENTTDIKEESQKPSQNSIFGKNNIPSVVFATLIGLNLLLTIALAGVVYWIMGSALLNHSNPKQSTNGFNPSISTREIAPTAVSVQASPTYSQIPNDWIYPTQPYLIGTFEANTTQQTLLKFDTFFSKDIKLKQILVAIHVYNGHPGGGQWYAYNIRTSVKNGDKEFFHFTFGRRGDHRLAIWNSETVRFPASNARELRIRSNKTMTECPIDYYLVGYRKE